MGARYVWVDFHEWCGPAFFTNADMNKVYDPVDENDPVWPEFTKWLDKHNAAKAKKQARSKTPNVGIEPPRSGRLE